MKVGSGVIHVMHVQESLEIGGLENGVINVSNGLDQSSFKTTICCLNRLGPLTGRIRNPNVSYFTLDQGEGKALHVPLTLRRIFRESSVDIVHTHDFYSGIYGIIGGRLAGGRVHVVHGEHGMILKDSRRRHIFGGLVYRLAHKHILVSRDLEVFMNRLGITPSKTVTILNGVDLDKFSSKRNLHDLKNKKKELGLPGTARLIGCIGTFSEKKGHRYLISAMKRIYDLMTDVHLVMIGDGPLGNNLRNQALELGLLERVHFIESRDDLDEVYPIFDIFAFPSLWGEGIANVLLEAMASGVPIVATNIRGNNELLRDDETALLASPESEEALSHNVMSLLSDSERSLRLSQAARRYVEQHFSLERMVNQYADIYRDLVSPYR
jgi:glycosyltransferase involved in cell wall biosynthesis